MNKISFSANVDATISDDLCFKKSPVDGNGLFSVGKIEEGTVIHPTHFRHIKYGWINLVPNYKYNHSKINENCKIVTENNTKFLVAIRDLSPDEEIFVDYTKDLDLEQPMNGWRE